VTAHDGNLEALQEQWEWGIEKLTAEEKSNEL
jgi:hypothetical protein